MTAVFFENLAVYIVTYGEVVYGSNDLIINVKEILKDGRDYDEQVCK